VIGVVARKVKSALGLLRGDDPWGQIRMRAGENLRAARLSLAGRDRLYYRHASGFRYVVLPEVPETRHLYHRGQTYEWMESRIVARWLEAGDFALDCGANVGLISALMAERVGAAGTVWALEPSPSSATKLEAVVGALGLRQIHVRRDAVSDVPGDVIFGDDASASEANAIRAPGNDGGTPSARVPSISLQALLADGAPCSPALVKMDIEGAEPLAFRGWPALAEIPDPPLFVFEVYPRGLARLGLAPSDIFVAMPLRRYRLWHLNASWPNEWPQFPRGVPFALADPFGHPWPTHSNVVALPVEGAFAARAGRLRGLLP
jgi:FkbM family methyltransferase